MKLNGGLGTGMGLEKAKSLLTVKGSKTFLDLIASQVCRRRKQGKRGRRWEGMSQSTAAEVLGGRGSWASKEERGRGCLSSH